MAGIAGGGGHAQGSQRRHRVGRTFPVCGHQEHVHDKSSSSKAERRPCSSVSTSDALRQSSTHDSRTESRPLKFQNTTVNPGGNQVGTRCSTDWIRPPSISVIPAQVSPESEKQRVANLPRVGCPRWRI